MQKPTGNIYVRVNHSQCMLPYTLLSILFQWMMEAQNRRIDELVDRIKQQQEKLDKQNIRIRALQNQVGYFSTTQLALQNSKRFFYVIRAVRSSHHLNISSSSDSDEYAIVSEAERRCHPSERQHRATRFTTR